MRLHLFPALLLSLFTTLALAGGDLLDPKNDPEVQAHMGKGYLEIPVEAQPQSGMAHDQALELREDFLAYAAPLLTRETRQLSVEIDWENPFFTAHARYRGNTNYIGLWGGYLRAPGLNPAILAVTLCHELGHLIGGQPKQTNEEENLSTEGQSDFFAGLNCTADFLRAYPRHAPKISEEVRNFCEGHHDCELSLESGLQTYRFLQKWGFAPYSPVSIQKRAAEANEFIPNTYPVYQCRLDSFTTAATCLKNGTRETCLPPPCWWPVSLPYPPN